MQAEFQGPPLPSPARDVMTETIWTKPVNFPEKL